MGIFFSHSDEDFKPGPIVISARRTEWTFDSKHRVKILTRTLRVDFTWISMSSFWFKLEWNLSFIEWKFTRRILESTARAALTGLLLYMGATPNFTSGLKIARPLGGDFSAMLAERPRGDKKGGSRHFPFKNTLICSICRVGLKGTNRRADKNRVDRAPCIALDSPSREGTNRLATHFLFSRLYFIRYLVFYQFVLPAERQRGHKTWTPYRRVSVHTNTFKYKKKEQTHCIFCGSKKRGGVTRHFRIPLFSSYALPSHPCVDIFFNEMNLENNTFYVLQY